MEENIRKVRISTIAGRSQRAVKRGRIHRFSKWIEKEYGIPWCSMYDKMRKNRIKTWEGKGIIRCMDEYGFNGTPSELWNKCVRNKFCQFMTTQQMSHMTTWKRFSKGTFSNLEMEGISATYKYWRECIDSLNR